MAALIPWVINYSSGGFFKPASVLERLLKNSSKYILEQALKNYDVKLNPKVIPLKDKGIVHKLIDL